MIGTVKCCVLAYTGQICPVYVASLLKGEYIGSPYVFFSLDNGERYMKISKEGPSLLIFI